MNTNKTIMLALSATLLNSALLFTGCTSIRNKEETQPKLQNVQYFNIDGKEFAGVQLLKSNGKIFAGYFRAANGLVLCPHFDLAAMEKAGIPAALAGKWSKNSLEQEISEKIIKVNNLAKKKGVKIGMSVKEALLLLEK